MDRLISEPPELPVTLITAKQAKLSMPQFQPVDRKVYRKVMNYTFEVIKQRSSVGFSYVELSLTKIPELEAKRIKVLKRLKFDIQELEFSLHVNWNRE